MNNIYKKAIVYIAVYIMIFSSFVVLAHGTATSITIYGTNQSNAQTNVTCYGCNQTISVQAWNTSYVKNISVHSRNGSGGDVVSFNISNVTGYRVQELKVNGTSINAYQAGANGMLNFSYTVIGNRTLTLSPASTMVGYNSTWWFFQTIRAIGAGDSSFAGNVGIGETNPSYPLDVEYAAGGWAAMIRDTSGGVTRGGVLIGGIENGGRIQGVTTGSATSTLVLNDQSGNVGIGTTSPVTKLDVNGVISGNGSGLSSLNASNVTGLPVSTQYISLGIVKDTVYYNNNQTALFVNMRANCDTSRGMRARSDASNPPLASVASFVSAGTGADNSLAFIVLSGNYYMMSDTGVACANTNSTIWR